MAKVKEEIEAFQKRQEAYNLKNGTVRMSKEIGGESCMNKKTLEWPSDEYLDGLTQEEFDDLQITSIVWIVGTVFGPEHDFAHAIRFKNNLDDSRNISPAYTDKSDPSDKIEFTNKRIAKITVKTNYHHVAQFRFYDDFDNLIGKTIYSKYDDNNDDEFEVLIGFEEKLIGFHVRQSDWEDCKTAKVSFKIAKTTKFDLELQQKVIEYKNQQKQEQEELMVQFPRDTAFCLYGWDPVNGDIKWHDHETGWKESLTQSRTQTLALLKEKAAEKDVGFLHHVSMDVKAIIEKNLTGQLHRNGCSIHLWATKQDDKNQLDEQLAVIAGRGFITNTEQVDEEVKNYDDALAKIKAKPKEEKTGFYVYDK